MRLTSPRPWLAAVLALAALTASALPFAEGRAGRVIWLLHLAAPAAALLFARSGRGPAALLLCLSAAASGGAVFSGGAGPARWLLLTAHVVLGLAAAAVLAAGLLPAGSRRRTAVAVGAVAALLVPAAVHAVAVWGPKGAPEAEYPAEECYRFLTASTAEQSGAPYFPSALRRETPGADGCTATGCHGQEDQCSYALPHAEAGSGRAYRAVYREFRLRRGTEAARWCEGCHTPARLAGSQARGVDCLTCHGASSPQRYGSAALRVRPAPDEAHWEVRARPLAHRRRYGPAVLGQAELCGSCHRKNWNLPQNGYRWMPGPDAYREWLTGPWSGRSLLTAEPGAPTRDCRGCHADGRPAPARDALRLAAFLRPARGPATEWGRLNPAPGERVTLEVTLHNEGIGHDFPYGMPDLHECWLEVRVHDRAGRPALRSGSRTLRYRLRALDRDGRPVLHGDLDRMARVAEWRRIPPGETDLARYSFAVPPGGLGAVEVRLVRARRADFAAWIGEASTPETLASWTDGSPPGGSDAERWGRYALSLASVRDFPAAEAALDEARRQEPRAARWVIAAGRIALQEGDLLAAQEHFSQARHLGGGAQAAAWLGIALRQIGQPEQALSLLSGPARRYPEDLRLRFELGRTHAELLRHREALKEFEGLLAADPLDGSGHFNRMLVLQRLNRLGEARREEVLYRLLSGDGRTADPRFLRGITERTPAVFELEPVP